MIEEKIYSIKVNLLFNSVDSVNNQLSEIKNELKKSFDKVIVHYDLAEEKDDFGNNCFGIGIELFRYGPEKSLTMVQSMSEDAISVVKKFDVRCRSIVINKDSVYG